MWLKKAVATISLIAGASASFAAPTTLDFEDFNFRDATDIEAVDAAYQQQYGIGFSNAWAVLSSRADRDGNGTPDGGLGNFYGAGQVAITPFDEDFPEDTVRSSFIINIDGGFGANLLISYATLNESATVNIWSGQNGSGSLLGTGNLSGMLQTGCEPLYLCSWRDSSLDFNGTAHSVQIAGTTGRLFIDAIRFGNADTPPPTGVPEPASWALAAAGLAAAVLGRRRSARKHAA